MARKKCPGCLKWGANRCTCKASTTTKTDVAPEKVELRKAKERADMTKKTSRGSDGDRESEKLALQVQLEAMKVRRLTLQKERDMQKSKEKETKRREEDVQNKIYYNRNWWSHRGRRAACYRSYRDEAEYYPGEVSCSMRNDGCN